MSAFKLWLAFLLDLGLGDPQGWPHPVRWLGRLIRALEDPLRRRFPVARTAGIVLAGLCLLLVATTVLLLVAAARGSAAWLGLVVEVVLIYWAISLKDLVDHARAVYEPLCRGDLEQARTALSWIVGRETAELPEAGIIRATVETIAENAVDGVLSPLFYAALGGPLGAWLYKTVSTLDSMVGYKNERYLEFGWAGAKLDDLANWLPARLSGIFFTLAAAALGYDWRGCWRIWWRDGRKHPSPNAGWPEAAISGALGLRLGGPSRYEGRWVEKPWLGDGNREPQPQDILKAIRLLYGVGFLAAGVFGLSVWLWF